MKRHGIASKGDEKSFVYERTQSLFVYESTAVWSSTLGWVLEPRWGEKAFCVEARGQHCKGLSIYFHLLLFLSAMFYNFLCASLIFVLLILILIILLLMLLQIELSS